MIKLDDLNNATQKNIDLSKPFGYLPENNDAQKKNLHKVLTFLAEHENTPKDKKQELI